LTTADPDRIANALGAAAEGFSPGRVAHVLKEYGDLLTDVDIAVDGVLWQMLPRPGEGWLSEETGDDRERLGCARNRVGSDLV